MSAGSIPLSGQVRGVIRVLQARDAVGNVTRGAAVAFSIQLISLAAAYASQVFLARWMGITEFGKFSYAISWATILSMFTALGLPDAVVRLVPEYLGQQQWGRVRAVINGSRQAVISVNLLAALTVTAVGVALREFISYSLAIPLILSGGVCLLLALVRFQSEAFRSLHLIGWSTTTYNLLRPVLLLAVVFVLLSLGIPVTSTMALLVSMATLLSIAVFQRLFLARMIPVQYRNSQFPHKTGSWIRLALPMLLSSASVTLITQVGVLVVGFFRPADEAGLFAAAARVSVLVAFVLTAVNTAVAPAIASAFSRRDAVTLRRVVESSAHLSFWPSIAVSTFFFVFASKIMSLFGSDFTRADWVLRILIVSQMVNVGVGSVANLLTMTGNQNVCARSAVISAVVTIVACIVATPLFGVIGAAVATAVGMSLWNLWMYRMVVERVQVQPSAVIVLCRRFGLGSVSS